MTGSVKTRKKRSGRRFSLIFSMGLLFLLLGLMVASMMSQLRDLSVARGDNMQWSISQIETEFANLDATLSKKLSDGVSTDLDVRLRLDIAISRMEIVNSGRAAALFAGNSDADKMLEPIIEFGERAIEIADSSGELSEAEIRRLRELTEHVRPLVRKLALLGVEIHAERSAQRRADLSLQRKRTGGLTIVLLFLLAGLMLHLDDLRQKAVKRDAELITSSKFLKSTVDASLDAIVTATDRGEIIEFNAAAEKIFGWKSDEVVGKTMAETFIPERLRKNPFDGLDGFIENGMPRVSNAGRYEMSALRRRGEEFPVEVNVASIEDDDGKKFITYLRDISERKINEQKIIDARDRAERTDKAKTQFLTVMSHEMRTPLNGILGVLDLLKTTEMDKNQHRYADIATASGEVLLEHVNEALDITRIETGTLQVIKQDFDLTKLLMSVVNVLEPLAREKHLSLSIEFDDALRRKFRGDSTRIRQIMVNLVGNAIKYTDSGQISVVVGGINGPSGSHVKISVSDEGRGISLENCELIFEDFIASAHRESRQTRGGGLGLSISRKIARLMGGEISVVSEESIGSTFTLSVPLESAQELVVKDEILPKAELNSREILVVEDNEINRKVLGDMLRNLGHRVTEAANGLEGFEQAGLKHFDLIFMDISMPIMDGIEATKKIRESAELNRETNIAGLTAHGREEFRVAAEEVGMTSFNMKPIRLAYLREILNSVETLEDDTISEFADSSILRELCSALGSNLVLETGHKFFNELSQFIVQVQKGELNPGTPELAEAAHKIKGAAALLGQDELEQPLMEMEKLARSGDTSDIQGRIEGIKKKSEKAAVEFVLAVQRIHAVA